MTERPLSQITVKDIVTDCGINRNTFYYYFEDIPKLIETVVEEDAATIIQTYPTVENFGDCLEAVLDKSLGDLTDKMGVGNILQELKKRK